jgi:hypothetical protein
MHWTQKATEKINMTPVTKVRNLTKIPITPQIKGKLSVKRTLTWKSLARKIKKRIRKKVTLKKGIRKKVKKMKTVHQKMLKVKTKKDFKIVWVRFCEQ